MRALILQYILAFGIHNICSAELPPEFNGELLSHDLQEIARHFTEKYSISNLYNVKLKNILGTSDPDTWKNVSELISSKGYPVEEYSVTTEDGYILSLQRIPHGLHEYSSTTQQKLPVFLMHGFLFSAADFVLNFPSQSLGFILADAGYDVWLGNARGSTYSKRHVSLSIKSKEFWEFSFEEIGLYDVPAMIDFVLQKTNQKKLRYIGYSLGSIGLFCLFSEKPEYNEKISIGIAIAPTASCKNTMTDLRYLARVAPQIKAAYDLQGVYEFFPSSPRFKIIAETLCTNGLSDEICESIIFLITGHYMAQLNETRLHVYGTHTPAGTSTQNFVRISQMFNTEKLLKQDFGEEKNLQKYGTAKPPEYDLSKTTAPIVFFSSQEDLLADPADVRILASKVKSLVKSVVVPSPFAHIDFLWGTNATEYVYKEMLEYLRP